MAKLHISSLFGLQQFTGYLYSVYCSTSYAYQYLYKKVQYNLIETNLPKSLLWKTVLKRELKI